MKTKKVSPEVLYQINSKTALIWIYMDQAEKMVADLIYLTKENNADKQLIKQKLTSMKKTALQFREILNSTYKNNDEALLQFGIASDNEEKRLKIILFESLKSEFEPI